MQRNSQCINISFAHSHLQKICYVRWVVLISLLSFSFSLSLPPPPLKKDEDEFKSSHLRSALVSCCFANTQTTACTTNGSRPGETTRDQTSTSSLIRQSLSLVLCSRWRCSNSGTVPGTNIYFDDFAMASLSCIFACARLFLFVCCEASVGARTRLIQLAAHKGCLPSVFSSSS